MHSLILRRSAQLPNSCRGLRKVSNFNARAARIVTLLFVLMFGVARFTSAQGSNASSISGTVLDPSGASVAQATITIHDPVSGYARSATSDGSGSFRFSNVPFNTYHLEVTASGFAQFAQDVDVRSSLPVKLSIGLKIGAAATTVTVTSEAADLIEQTSTNHTDVDRGLFDKLPLESQSSSLSSLVTLASPGIAADSNGLFHGMGDHAENSFSVDGQPITDQQSKIFSNQIPLDSVESMEVISGAPPAEFGEKTSVVINVTTRSGQGLTTPHGAVTTSYGSFGTSNVGFNFGYGGAKWGNFVSVSGLNTGRFLDPPEFAVLHDKGNEENGFDRFDFQLSKADSIHTNLGFTRSWFQNPNSFDNLNVIGQFGNPVGSTDQRSQIKTFNIAPSWTHLLSSSAVFTLGAFVRRDQYNYYPSNNPLADIGPIQQETVTQDRTLTNSGLRSDVSYVKGMHNLKAGGHISADFPGRKHQLWNRRSALERALPGLHRRSGFRVYRSSGLRCGRLATQHCDEPKRRHSFPARPRMLRLDPPDAGRRRRLRRSRQHLVPISRACGYQTAFSVRTGWNHKGKLDAQPWSARRYLQRSYLTPGSRAALRSRLQREEDEYGAACFLRAPAGDSV
jgi:hypothetical protein